MKNIKIPSFLLSREQASALKLMDQGYIIFIPKKILEKIGIKHSPEFNLILEKNKVSLETARQVDRRMDRKEVYNEKRKTTR